MEVKVGIPRKYTTAGETFRLGMRFLMLHFRRRTIVDKLQLPPSPPPLDNVVEHRIKTQMIGKIVVTRPWMDGTSNLPTTIFPCHNLTRLLSFSKVLVSSISYGSIQDGLVLKYNSTTVCTGASERMVGIGWDVVGWDVLIVYLCLDSESLAPSSSRLSTGN